MIDRQPYRLDLLLVGEELIILISCQRLNSQLKSYFLTIYPHTSGYNAYIDYCLPFFYLISLNFKPSS